MLPSYWNKKGQRHSIYGDGGSIEVYCDGEGGLLRSSGERQGIGV